MEIGNHLSIFLIQKVLEFESGLKKHGMVAFELLIFRWWDFFYGNWGFGSMNWGIGFCWSGEGVNFNTDWRNARSFWKKSKAVGILKIRMSKSFVSTNFQTFNFPIKVPRDLPIFLCTQTPLIHNRPRN